MTALTSELPSGNPSAAPRRRIRFRYSLRTLFVVIALLAIVLLLWRLSKRTPLEGTWTSIGAPSPLRLQFRDDTLTVHNSMGGSYTVPVRVTRKGREIDYLFEPGMEQHGHYTLTDDRLELIWPTNPGVKIETYERANEK